MTDDAQEERLRTLTSSSHPQSTVTFRSRCDSQLGHVLCDADLHVPEVHAFSTPSTKAQGRLALSTPRPFCKAPLELSSDCLITHLIQDARFSPMQPAISSSTFFCAQQASRNIRPGLCRLHNKNCCTTFATEVSEHSWTDFVALRNARIQLQRSAIFQAYLGQGARRSSC